MIKLCENAMNIGQARYLDLHVVLQHWEGMAIDELWID